MKNINVLHVIGGNDTGGAMSYLLPLLAALNEQGCDARLLCLGDGGLAQAAADRGLPCAVVPMSHPWDVRVLAPLRRALADGWPIVHTHGMRANLPVRLVLPAVRPRPLLFTTIHSDLALDYADPLKARAYRLLDRATRAGVDFFCCVSHDLARRVVAAGVPGARVYVVHPGLEMVGRPEADAPGDAVAAVREAGAAVPAEGAAGSGADSGRHATGGAAHRSPTIGTVARLVAVKDLDLLLEALALVVQSVRDARLVIVGDGPERAPLERRAAEGDLAGRVEFLGTVVPARPRLAGFDVYALTSESEGIPISVLEAMAAGLPVVATAVGGLPETVQEGVTGFLVKRGEDRGAVAAALAGRMAELLADQRLRARMGAAGRLRVIEAFTSRAAGSTMLSIYQKAEAAAQRGRNQ